MRSNQVDGKVAEVSSALENTIFLLSKAIGDAGSRLYIKPIVDIVNKDAAKGQTFEKGYFVAILADEGLEHARVRRTTV